MIKETQSNGHGRDMLFASMCVLMQCGRPLYSHCAGNDVTGSGGQIVRFVSQCSR